MSYPPPRFSGSHGSSRKHKSKTEAPPSPPATSSTEPEKTWCCRCGVKTEKNDDPDHCRRCRRNFCAYCPNSNVGKDLYNNPDSPREDRAIECCQCGVSIAREKDSDEATCATPGCGHAYGSHCPGQEWYSGVKIPNAPRGKTEGRKKQIITIYDACNITGPGTGPRPGSRGGSSSTGGSGGSRQYGGSSRYGTSNSGGYGASTSSSSQSGYPASSGAGGYGVFPASSGSGGYGDYPASSGPGGYGDYPASSGSGGYGGYGGYDTSGGSGGYGYPSGSYGPGYR